MGCLFELIIFPIELLLDIIFDGYISLMQLIIPKKINCGLKIILKTVVTTVSLILLSVLIIGLLALILTDAAFFELRGLIFVPLSVMAVQIGLGFFMKLITKKR